MIKKILSVVISCFILLSFSSCNNDKKLSQNEYETLSTEEDIFKFIPPEKITKNKHVKNVEAFESEISTGYKNEDGTYTLYIFSSPIRYKKGVSSYVDIDNRIKKIYSGRYFDDGYIYKNSEGYVSSYFPSELDDDNFFLVENNLYEMSFGLQDIKLTGSLEKQKTSIWNQKNDTVVYNCDSYKINAYPTKAGIRTEITLNSLPENNKIDFIVKTPDLRKKVGKDYLTFVDDLREQDNQIQAVIRNPIVKDSYSGDTSEKKSHLFLKNKIMTETLSNGEHKVGFELDEQLRENKDLQFPIVVDIQWDMHTSKQPDSAVYSEKFYDNSYLSEYSVIGNSSFWGIGQNYLRLRLHEYIDDNPENIKSATYNVYEMSGFNSKIDIYINKVEEFWSSSEMVWMNKVTPGYTVNKTAVDQGGYVSFDITDLTKKALKDDTCNIESYGVVMEGNNKENSYRVFASSDNALFPPYEEITFYNMPKNINIYRK